MKQTILFFLLNVITISFYAQEKNKYIIYFKDKQVDKNVQQLFTKEAIEYRRKYNIPFDERDYAVNVNYIEQLKNVDATIFNTSNWLNASLISIDENKINQDRKSVV